MKKNSKESTKNLPEKKVVIQSIKGNKPLFAGGDPVSIQIRGVNLDNLSEVRISLGGKPVSAINVTLGPPRPRSRRLVIFASRQSRPHMPYQLEFRRNHGEWNDLIEWLRGHPVIHVRPNHKPIDFGDSHILDPDAFPIGIPGDSESAVVYRPQIESVQLTILGYTLIGQNFTQNQVPSLAPGNLGHWPPKFMKMGGSLIP